MLKNTFKRFLLLFVDLLIFCISLYFTFIIRSYLSSEIDSLQYYSLLYLFLPTFVFLGISLFVAELYDVPIIFSRVKRVSRIIYTHLTVSIISIISFYIFPDYFTGSPKSLLLIFIIINILLLSIWRVYGNFLLRKGARARALLIGNSAECVELRDQVNRHEFYPFYFIDHISISDRDLKENKIFHDAAPEEVISELRFILKKNNIKHIVLDIRNEEVKTLLPYIYTLSSEKIKLYDISQMYQDVFRKMPLSAIGYFWFFEHVALEKKIYEFLKRIIDLILCVPVLMIFAVTFPFIFFALKFEKEEGSSHEIFSVQKRLGQGGKVINIFKYRTMLFTDSGKWRREGDNQNRSTKIGMILNKTNLDEIPQVFNIIKGDMSFIGPRNDIIALGERLFNEIPYYMIRYSVKPGISGWAQTLQKVEGQNPQTIEQNITRFQYDLFYIKNRSLIIDFIIILRTIKTLISRLFGRLKVL